MTHTTNRDEYVITPQMVRDFRAPGMTLEETAVAIAEGQHETVFDETRITDVAVWQMNSRNITVRFTWTPIVPADSHCRDCYIGHKPSECMA